jgi:VIT1/CCC1 family predicted Fe2+/Mn2+ transporter
MSEESKLAEKLENSKKFSEEEMEELKNIQDGYLEVQNNLGQAKISLIRLEQQRENLLNHQDNLQNNFFEIQQKEKDFIEKVTEKYGDGELNPNTGEFTPQK